MCASIMHVFLTRYPCFGLLKSVRFKKNEPQQRYPPLNFWRVSEITNIDQESDLNLTHIYNYN